MRKPYHRQKQIKPLFYSRGNRWLGLGPGSAACQLGYAQELYIPVSSPIKTVFAGFNTERPNTASREKNVRMCLPCSNCWLLLLPHL